MNKGKKALYLTQIPLPYVCNFSGASKLLILAQISISSLLTISTDESVTNPSKIGLGLGQYDTV